jgi:hypothetical protein
MQLVHVILIALSVAVIPHNSRLTLSSRAFVHWTQAAPQGGQSEPQVIDGSKNPELFPEWYIWEMLFERLPPTAPAEQEKINHYSRLGLTNSEIQTLVREVRAFGRSKEILSQQLRTTRAALTASKKSESDIRDATQEVNLQYRYRILDARNRIYEELSPASIEKLRKFAYQLVAGTTVYLRGRAVEFFFIPR